MPGKRALRLKCPICKKTVQAKDPEFPFCSDRCRLIDLGKWASGAYRIASPGSEVEDEVQEEDEPERIN
jgi:endogenous inhibitor of DNA gyrase (YacG/DUF329 family)